MSKRQPQAGKVIRDKVDSGLTKAGESKKYRVLVDDNFHYMDEDERYPLGEFDTLEAAVAAAKKIVDSFLDTAYKPGMNAGTLYDNYTSFGEDPFVVGPGTDKKRFSAWAYAKARCAIICRGAN